VGVALVGIQEAAVRAQPGVDRPGTGAAGRSADRKQGQRAVGGDVIGGNRAGCGVHGEQELAVVGDLDPARGHLVIRERGAVNR
jgi:hypothetical protein